LNPLHPESARASVPRLSPGQIATEAKSNELTAIPLLLDLLDVKGHTASMDATGCQKEFAAKIVECEGDYLLALKDNSSVAVSRGQNSLPRRAGLAGAATRSAASRGGRNEPWPGLTTLLMMIRSRMVDGKETGHVTYCLSSLPPKVRRLA
jgi:hypothetical protein